MQIFLLIEKNERKVINIMVSLFSTDVKEKLSAEINLSTNYQQRNYSI